MRLRETTETGMGGGGGAVRGGARLVGRRGPLLGLCSIGPLLYFGPRREPKLVVLLSAKIGGSIGSGGPYFSV